MYRRARGRQDQYLELNVKEMEATQIGNSFDSTWIRAVFLDSMLKGGRTRF